MAKSFFIDTSRCTACRGCQVACKEWHELPANKTRQRGTHQNPADLNAYNYKLVRFSEHLENGTIRWLFFPDQCRHCVDPPCKELVETYTPDGVVHDKATGAVLYTEKTKGVPIEEVRASCPYNIPRQRPDGVVVKCDMCIDRVSNGLLPACVKVCPTGAMNFGERQAMLDLAAKRLEEARKNWPDAVLADPETVNAIFLLLDDPAKYHDFAVAKASGGMNRQQFLAKLLAPARKPVERMARIG